MSGDIRRSVSFRIAHGCTFRWY